MALQPSLRSTTVVGPHDAPHTIEIFVDYLCPFCAKMSRTLEDLRQIFSSTEPNPEFDNFKGKVKIIIRLHVQPWHASSTFTHEAAIAVARVAPESFWPFSLLLFKNQSDYFDTPTLNMTPLQIREKLTELAAQVIPDKIDEFKEQIELKPGKNSLPVTNDLKYTIKYARQNGIHVSPTVLWDGLVANEIDSGFTLANWSQFFRNNVVV